MNELKKILMELFMTLIYEAKKNREFIYGILLGIFIGKIS